MSLPKDYLYILDHIEYILTTTVVRLCLVLCLTFKMLASLGHDSMEEIDDGPCTQLFDIFLKIYLSCLENSA
jgi:hypothetical protein